jgi:pimeloyl-ACP methyl ester carboxylesterase
MRLLLAVLAALVLAAGAAAATVRVHGHAMYYVCRGSGSPTVVLDAGSPDTSTTWSAVQPRVARFTRSCAYDRAGLGRSAPARRGHRTALTQVADLRALLAAAHVPAPYVVVGHSWGGALAELFAARYGSATAGAVILDSFFPASGLVDLLRRGKRIGGPVRRIEHIDLLASIRQLRAVRTLGSLPLVVVQHGAPPVPKDAAAWNRLLAALSTGGVLAEATSSGHAIPSHAPAVAVAAIRGVVASVRGAAPLASCPELFAGLPARCLAP